MRNWKSCLSILLATSRRPPCKSRIRLALCGIVMLTVTTGASALTITTPSGHVQQASGHQFVIPADTITPPVATPTAAAIIVPAATPTVSAIIVPAATPTAAAIIVPAATPTVAAIIMPAATPTVAAIVAPATPPADTSVTISTDDPPTTTAKSDNDNDDNLCHFPQMSISFTFAQKVIASAQRVR